MWVCISSYLEFHERFTDFRKLVRFASDTPYTQRMLYFQYPREEQSRASIMRVKSAVSPASQRAAVSVGLVEAVDEAEDFLGRTEHQSMHPTTPDLSVQDAVSQ
jgi:hypothetical protein